MIDLLARRRAMLAKAGSGSGGGKISDYVQEGLIFHLDGILRGDTPGHWIDRVGNVDFALDSGVTEDLDGIICNTDNYARNAIYGGTEATISSYTVECAFREDGGFKNKVSVFIPVSGIGMAATSGSNPRFYIGWRDSSSSTNQWLCYKRESEDAINTVSINITRGLRNGSSMTSSGQIYGNLGAECIAGKFSGKLFGVRIYSRTLSASEMLKNQKVDNIRFNLGLTLPDSIE